MSRNYVQSVPVFFFEKRRSRLKGVQKGTELEGTKTKRREDNFNCDDNELRKTKLTITFNKTE